MSDSGELNSRKRLRRLRNRRRRRLNMKKVKIPSSPFGNGPGRGGGGGGGGGGCGGFVRARKGAVKNIDYRPVEEPEIDNFDEDSCRDRTSMSVAYSLDEEDHKNRSVTCRSHGWISVIGRRRTMEDTVAVVVGLVDSELSSYDFFAVYDGHGGDRIANACRDRMHRMVAEEVERGRAADGGGGGKGLEYWEKVMVKCFDRMDEEVMSGNGEDGEGESSAAAAAMLSAKMTGSTAVVVMVGKDEVVVANCGDSRAVLCRGSVALPLSRDHKVTFHFLFIQ